MTRPDDRIPVPTNGHRPPLSATAGADTVADEAAPAAAVPEASRLGFGVNATPAQLAVGFGIITWVIAYLIGRWRGRRS
jgi:hypothetical protein